MLTNTAVSIKEQIDESILFLLNYSSNENPKTQSRHGLIIILVSQLCPDPRKPVWIYISDEGICLSRGDGTTLMPDVSFANNQVNRKQINSLIILQPIDTWVRMKRVNQSL